MTCYLGLDPGVSGAIASISERFRIFLMPIKDHEIDVPVLLDWILSDCQFPIYACVELVYAPKRLIRDAGILEGALKASNIGTYRVAPESWRNAILDDAYATKRDAISYCEQNYPTVTLLRTSKSRLPDHNIAEAICIAEYCKRFISEPNNSAFQTSQMSRRNKAGSDYHHQA
jgi:hypothetical protein